MSAGAAGAAAAAAAARQRLEHEEEDMTLMNTDPSGNVEYKIIRSVTGAFKNPAKFRAFLEEEARAGWDLVEKLDNNRARLRRPIECRKRDAELGQDPYRTQVGTSETTVVLWILISVLLGIPLFVGIVIGVLALVLH
jgi:hypothetical protein